MPLLPPPSKTPQQSEQQKQQQQQQEPKQEQPQQQQAQAQEDDDDDEGEWQEMPIVRSAVSQMPKSAFSDLDDDELRRYKYRPPSPGATGGLGSPTGGSGLYGGADGPGSAGGMRGKRDSRTGNATGRNLDIDDARGFNWRSKPAGVGGDGGADDDYDRRRRRSESNNVDAGGGSGDADEDEEEEENERDAAKGYTQLRIDEDQEAEQLHDATQYLFGAADMIAPGQQEFPAVTPLSQLATTKQLLTEQQKIAYVGLCSLATREMVRQLERVPGKEAGVVAARQSVEEWRKKVMAGLYQHMDIDDSEQKMIESLAQHGVLVEDLAPSLITTHTVQNPDYDPEAAEEREEEQRRAAAEAEKEASEQAQAHAKAHPDADASSSAEPHDAALLEAAEKETPAQPEQVAEASSSTPRPSTSSEADRPLPDAPASGDVSAEENEAAEAALGQTDASPDLLSNEAESLADIEDSGDLSSAGAMAELSSEGPAAKVKAPAAPAGPDEPDEADIAVDRASTPTPSAPHGEAEEEEDITSAAQAPPKVDPPHPDPPEGDEDKKAPVLVDPNTAGQLDAQLSTSRPPIGGALGLTAEPIPIEPPPAALEGVTTSLSTADKSITLDIRWTVLCDLFLVLTAESMYDARSRVLLERVAEALSLTWMDVTQFEKRITDALEIEEGVEKLRNRRAIAEREKLARKKRYVMMGLATVGGGLVIGLSAGLLAPVIGAGLGAALGAVGIGGTTTFLGGVGGAAIITTAGTLGGAGIAGKGMSRRTRSVKTFEFKAIHNNKRVNCIVGMPGFMSGQMDDVRLPFSVLDSIMGDVFSVLWEPDMMQEMGNSLSILWNETLTQGVQQLLALTVAGGLVGALAWPMWLLKLGYLIDNPWSNALDRAKAAGLILADVLSKRQLGVRPITLVGFSLGARAIFYALVELARIKAFGVVQNVYILGTPVTASDSVWKEARSVVAGRFVNVFSRSDWILGYLYRATSGGLRSIAGLHPVDHVPDIENVDVTHVIPGHLAYRALMPLVLSELQFRTTADYFDEPVDLNAIPIRSVVQEEEEAAAAAAAAEESKSNKFTKMFRRTSSTSGSGSPVPGATPGQSAEKKLPATRPPIEEYDEDLPERMEHAVEPAQPPPASDPHAVLPRPSIQSPPVRDSLHSTETPTRMGMPSPHFDADAILAELRQSGVQVRELKSFLPPLVATPTSEDAAVSSRPPVPAKNATLQVHNPPSPVHDRSRSNSFTAPPSPSLHASSPRTGSSNFGSLSHATGSTADFHSPGGGAAASPALRSISSSSFHHQQEDFGTARDRGLSRQLPSLSVVGSMLSPSQHDLNSATATSSGAGGMSAFELSDGASASNHSPAAAPLPLPSTTKKGGAPITMGFHPFDESVWGGSAPTTTTKIPRPPASAPAGGPSSMMGLSALGPPPPNEPVLTFGGEDGEVSLGSPTHGSGGAKLPASAPWNAENPWG
ncbi:hypothetical protein OC835_002797 [Tilletia horrida]|nr:hypothetical protein OC835_002797 [Tilletia horrida]